MDLLLSSMSQGDDGGRPKTINMFCSHGKYWLSLVFKKGAWVSHCTQGELFLSMHLGNCVVLFLDFASCCLFLNIFLFYGRVLFLVYLLHGLFLIIGSMILICIQEKWLCHNLGRIIIPYAWAMMIIERRKRIMVIEYGHRESCYRKIFIIAWAMMYNYVSHLCGQH